MMVLVGFALISLFKQIALATILPFTSSFYCFKAFRSLIKDCRGFV
jgi:hypothetical protein